MKFSDRIITAIRHFLQKYWLIIVAVAVIWIGIILLNNYLKNKPKEVTLKNTLTQDTPVINKDATVPRNKVDEVKNIINNFFNYCNDKKYEQAYRLLTDDCKNYMYGGSIDEFQEYVDGIYTKKKIYNIQNYSNVGTTYIYNIRILDDIMSTGTTGGYETYQEKIAVINDNGEMKISNQGYIGKSTFRNVVGEDEYLKVKVLSKNMSYTREEYMVEIKNKTDGYILVGNGATANEITLNLGDQTRQALDLSNNEVILAPGSSKIYYLLFDKYVDDGKTPTELNLNLIRVYGNNRENADNGKTEDATKAYSMNIPLK